MHKNALHALLLQTNTAGASRIVAALNRASVTAPKTAQRFRELYAQSQHFFFALFAPLLSLRVSFMHFAIAFAPTSLTPADLHIPFASAATAANFSPFPP